MNLHDELGRHGADAVADSAQRLSSSDVRSALGSRVRRGRRRRAVGGGVGAVAGIALVAVGVWGVLPGPAIDAEPAGTPTASPSGTALDAAVYRVGARANESDVLPVDLRMLGELQCGAQLELESGVTAHDDLVVEHDVTLSVASQRVSIAEQVYLDNVAELSGDDWQNLTLNNPAQVQVGENWHVFRASLNWQDGGSLTITTASLLLHEGQVAGVGPLIDNAWEGSPGTGRIQPMALWSPVPGECASGDMSFADGAYEPVVVTQVRSASSDEPLATIVASAGEIEYTGLGEPEVDDSDSLGSTWGDDALASAIEVREWTGGLECAALLDDQAFVTGTGDAGDVVGSINVPSTIETGRLYGYGDDALVGGYPIPVNGSEDGTDPISRMADIGEMRLLLRGVDETWVLDARWSERDDLPHDEPGWFVELNQVWDCGSPDLIPEGEYSASLVVPEMGDVYDLTPITVVPGVPSIPEIDAQG